MQKCIECESMKADGFGVRPTDAPASELALGSLASLHHR